MIKISPNIKVITISNWLILKDRNYHIGFFFNVATYFFEKTFLKQNHIEMFVREWKEIYHKLLLQESSIAMLTSDKNRI